MAAELELPNLNDLLRRYREGESVNSLAKAWGVSRKVIQVRLIRHGIQPRGQGEAERVKWARMTDGQRERQVRAAHEASRGRITTTDTLTRKALTIQTKGGFYSEYERELHDLLLQLGVRTIPQMAVGPYNCDLGAEPVAVEVFGGHWHWSGRHLRRLGKRVNYLINASLHVLVVQVDTLNPVTADTADYVAAYIKKARSDPTARREYRVIRGAGETIALARDQFDYRTLVPAFRVSRDALGRYVSVPH